MFDRLKTRKGRLELRIKQEFEKEVPSYEKIIEIVEKYNQDNLNTIEKLKKIKKVEMKRINGALRQTINAHGVINKALIGSATKRIYGALIVNPNQEETEDKRFSVRDILIGLTVGLAIGFLFYII